MGDRNNVKSFFMSLFIAAASSSCVHASDDKSGADGNLLLKKCSAAIKILDADPSSEDLADATFCLGYVAGFEAGHNLTVFENRRRNKNSNVDFVFCTTKRDVTQGQKARVVLKFLQENPQLLDLPMEILTELAFVRAFPCK